MPTRLRKRRRRRARLIVRRQPRPRLVLRSYASAAHPFDETKHPRILKGQKGGGRFTRKLLSGLLDKPEHDKGIEAASDGWPAPDARVRSVLTRDGKTFNDTQSMWSHVGKSWVGEMSAEEPLTRVVQREGRIYDSKRRKVHEKIVQRALVGEHREQNPEILFAAGGPASGKSSAIGKLSGDGAPPPRAVVIDPDAVKAQLPEHKRLKDHPYMPVALHEESSDISKVILDEAKRRRRNVFVDGTGNSGTGKFLGKIREAKAQGYRTRVTLVDTSADIARERNLKRARTVPEPIFSDIHASVAARHLQWRGSSDVDEWQVFNNDGPSPVLIAYGGGGKVVVLNKALYDAFLAKSKGVAKT